MTAAATSATGRTTLARPAPATMLSCDVVICCYTPARWADLVAAVGSVERQSCPAARVVIVVDHHDDLHAAVLRRFPQHDVVASGWPKGLSGARNAGVERATAPVVAFLDDDAIADEHWLARTVAWFANPKVVGVGARVEARFAGGRPAWFPPEFDWVVGCSYTGQPDVAAVVRNPIGAAMAFRREVFARVGGFRGDIGRIGRGVGGCEETELGLRATADGALIVLDPDARASQAVPPSRQRFGYFVRRCYGEGKSTAAVARHAGANRGTAAERSYVARTLTVAVGRDVRAAWRGEPARLRRAGSCIAGLAATTAGFAVAKLDRRRADVAAPPTLALAD